MRIRSGVLPTTAGILLPGMLLTGLTIGKSEPRGTDRVSPLVQHGDLVTVTLTPTPFRRPLATLTPPLHLHTGGVSYILSDLQAQQAVVDRGGERYRLDPVNVAVHDLPRYGFAPGGIEVVTPPAPYVAPTAHTGEDGLPETDVIVRFAGHQYWIVLNQFVRHGNGGIWSIVTITPM